MNDDPAEEDDLTSLRRQLGDATFEVRLEEARRRERIVQPLDALLAAGTSFPDAIERLGISTVPMTLRRWLKQWRAHGLGGLFDHRRGPTPGPRSTPPADTQLTLLPTEERPPKPPTRAHRNQGPPASLLKWSGSKAPIADLLVTLAPADFGRYHEPFLGGGSLFFTLQPERSVLGDSNAELINLYQVVRDEPEPLILALSAHQNTKEHYLAVRGVHPDKLPKVERAARTLFLNRTCFNGLYRVNRSGLFNVPYGDQTHTDFFHPTVLRKAHLALRGSEIVCEDFAACAGRAEEGDFLYLDPPYAAGMNDGQRYKYQADGFGEPEQRRVAELFRLLDERGCLVMASNADCLLTRDLYAGFAIEALSVRRIIGGVKERRGSAGEIVVRNYKGRRGALPGHE